MLGHGLKMLRHRELDKRCAEISWRNGPGDVYSDTILGQLESSMHTDAVRYLHGMIFADMLLSCHD